MESAENSVSVVDITETPEDATFFKSEGLPPVFPGNTTNTWGSAWKTAEGAHNYELTGPRVFFTRDYGGALYELTKIDTTTKTATFQFVTQAENATWHDGFICIRDEKESSD